jgi:hypothetical protein
MKIDFVTITIYLIVTNFMNKQAEMILVVLLRISAGVLLLALAPIFFPHSWMAAINRAIGLAELPDTALMGYLTRSLSALYAFHGALLLFVSFNVRRYLPLIIFFAATAVVFGILLLSLDIYLAMPLFWIICEGPMMIVFYAAILAVAVYVQRNITQ